MTDSKVKAEPGLGERVQSGPVQAQGPNIKTQEPQSASGSGTGALGHWRQDPQGSLVSKPSLA